jgi:hypothetical protein
LRVTSAEIQYHMKVPKQFGALLKMVLQGLSGNTVIQLLLLLNQMKLSLSNLNHLLIRQLLEKLGKDVIKMQVTEIFLT